MHCCRKYPPRAPPPPSTTPPSMGCGSSSDKYDPSNHGVIDDATGDEAHTNPLAPTAAAAVDARRCRASSPRAEVVPRRERKPSSWHGGSPRHRALAAVADRPGSPLVVFAASGATDFSATGEDEASPTHHHRRPPSAARLSTSFPAWKPRGGGGGGSFCASASSLRSPRAGSVTPSSVTPSSAESTMQRS